MALYRRGSKWWMTYRVSGRKMYESTGTCDRKKAELVMKARLAEAEQRRLAQKIGVVVPEDLADAKKTLRAFIADYEKHYVNAGGPALRASRERSWRGDHWALDLLARFFESKGVTKVAKVARRDVEAFRDWRLSTPIAKRLRPVVTVVRRKGGRWWLRYKLSGQAIREECDAKTRKAAEERARSRQAELEDEHPPKCPSAATVNHDLRVGKAAWSWAVVSGIARDNPFKGVKLIKLPTYEPRNLSELEIHRAIDAAKRESAAHYGLFCVALYAGLRLAELAALEWPDVDFGDGVTGGVTGEGSIRVRCSALFHTKSRKPRTIPLAAELRAVLKPMRSTLGLCFRSEASTPLDERNIRRAIARISRRSGVDFSIHDLRRTFAGLLAARGVPAWRIRDYLGHQSVATTEGYYVARGSVEAADVAGLRFGAAEVEKAAPAGRATARSV